jgi:hypothetical protein
LYTQDPIVVYPVSLALIGAAILVSLLFAPRDSVTSNQLPVTDH